MAARALARFIVRHGRIVLRVRLLPTIADVDAEFRDGRRRQNNGVVFAYFAPAGARARHVGTVVFPADADLMELIPHEVTHAVMRHLGGIQSYEDEALPTSVGILTTRIVRQLMRRGLEV